MHAMAANGPARPPDTEEYLLSSTHEEADTRLLLHALSAIRNGCKIIIIRASDTDNKFMVIALYLFEQLASEGLEELFIKSKDYIIPVHDVEKVFSDRLFWGRGYEQLETPLKQRTWLHILNQYAKRKLEVGENIPENIISRSVNLVVFTSLYYFETLDALRYYLYARIQTKILPPADDALKQHVLRSLYQTQTWVQAAQPAISVLLEK